MELALTPLDLRGGRANYIRSAKLLLMASYD
jgi:hypothetical protein